MIKYEKTIPSKEELWDHTPRGCITRILGELSYILSLHMCDAQGPWNPDQITEYRLNFSVLFGVMSRNSIKYLLHQKTFKPFLSMRAKVKIRPG